MKLPEGSQLASLASPSSTRLAPDSRVDKVVSSPSHVSAPPTATDLATTGLPQLLKIAGSIVAPTTLLTGLLFYFGWSHAYWFFNYFGVNSTMLGLVTKDYLMRSIDGLFVPLTVITSIVLLAFWGHKLLHTRLVAGSRARVLRVFTPATAITGLVLFTIGLWGVFAQTVFEIYLAVSPFSLASGVLLLVYASHLQQATKARHEKPRGHNAAPEWSAVVEWAGVFVLVGLSLFWAVNDYSAAVGISRARTLESQLGTYPSAVVYSAQSLSLKAPGVREVACQNSDAAYRFRYDGLKLVLQSGDQYFFLPQDWSPADGVAIVMPRNDSLRLEFTSPSANGAIQRAAC